MRSLLRRTAWAAAAVCSLPWAAICVGQVSAEEAVSDVLDEDPFGWDPDETGFLVGASVGNVDYEFDGSLGRWKGRSSQGPVTVPTFQVLYKAHAYLSIGAFHELAGAMKVYGVSNEALNRIDSHKFRSEVSGLTFVGTLFPDYRVRLRGIVNGLWANQSLEAGENEIGQRQEQRCEKDKDPPYNQTCTWYWVGNTRQLSSIRDSKSRFGFGYGIGVEVQWIRHVRFMLDFSTRKLGDDYFDDSLHLDSTQRQWQLGFQYGPF